ncbi:MAG TPA: DUF4126 family protein [Gemmatimonadales bacterium]|jgi:uncharacterized membrane protein|nr:DUF4126 family protein [Gemmatimonadales bacterium]
MSSGFALALAFGIGVVCGLRSMTAPAVVSWAARLGWLDVSHTWLAFLGYAWTPYILSVLAVGELVADKLPMTPSRKAPGPFGTRIVLGALSGAALTAGHGQSWALGAMAGAVGGIIGTVGGYAARTGLVRALKVPDFVIALLEDVVAVGGGLFLVSRF